MNRDDQRWPRYDVINDGCMAYGISSTHRVYIGYIGHISPVLTQLTQFSFSFSHNIVFVNFLKVEILTSINLLSYPDPIIGLPWQHSTTGLFVKVFVLLQSFVKVFMLCSHLSRFLCFAAILCFLQLLVKVVANLRNFQILWERKRLWCCQTQSFQGSKRLKLVLDLSILFFIFS